MFTLLRIFYYYNKYGFSSLIQFFFYIIKIYTITQVISTDDKSLEEDVIVGYEANDVGEDELED
jgi:hypothetical protein